jgi:hypothetical protein
MAHRAGSADLPLHGGRVPKWLGDRMTRLGTVITDQYVPHVGDVAMTLVHGAEMAESRGRASGCIGGQ